MLKPESERKRGVASGDDGSVWIMMNLFNCDLDTFLQVLERL
jgi:hypothetical protein